MQVIVREKKYNYESDYPDKWHFAHGDHFKIVRLDNGKDKATCFVKRFEVKTPERISGWGLMEQLEDKNIPKLARLYDIVKVEEGRRAVYYVFSEYIEGETLYSLISKNTLVDLEKLADSLFKATATLQEKNYWFPDFTEKNIFYSRRAGFVLIDLDSTQPVSVPPDKDIWGEKEYWALVFDFYTKFLRVQMVPADIHGTTLTYLCVVFLILRIKIFQELQDREYGSLYDELTAFLYNASPAFAAIFEKVFQDKHSPAKPGDVEEIIRLVNEHILPLTKETIIDIIEGRPAHRAPLVKAFYPESYIELQNDEYVVDSNEGFTLRWELENATRIELYKDGTLFHTGASETSLEVAGDTGYQPERNVEFTLVALNDHLEKASASVTVLVKPAREPEPVVTRFIINHYLKKEGDDNYTVELGNSFVLEGEVENSSSVQLYKNGSLWQTFKDERSIRVSDEVNDETEKKIDYVLVASNDSLEKTASHLFVTVIDNRPPPPVAPVIKRFLVTDYFRKSGKDMYEVINGQSFVLGWEVENASSINLLKNGKPYKVLKGDKGSITSEKEAADGRRVEYLLRATHDGASVESNSITLEFVDQLPVINDFRATRTSVKPGKPFRLIWEVENISQLQLLRNGKLYQTINPADGSIELTQEKSEENEVEVIYTLLASTDAQTVKSEPVIVTIAKGANWGMVHIATLSAIALAIVAGVYYYYNYSPKPRATQVSVDPFTQKVIAQNDTITITGENFPGKAGSVQVEFLAVPGKIISQTRNRIRVQVPLLTVDSGVTINVYANGAFFNAAENVLYDKRPAVVAAASLPLTLHEIWRSNTGNQLMYIDLLQRVLYYSTGDKNRYDTASTLKATYDTANGTYKIPITIDGVDKLLFIKNSTTGSFELCVARNEPGASCNSFTRMFLNYGNDPSLIYLPAPVNEEQFILDPGQSRRFFNLLNKQGRKNWQITLHTANPFLQPSSLDALTGILKNRGITYSIAEENAGTRGSNPFERNYITMVPAKIDTAKNETSGSRASTAGTAGTNTGTAGTTTVITGGTSASTNEAEVANGFDLGHLRFNARNEPDDVSKEILGVIASQLKDDNAARITFYATWSTKEDEKAVAANISSLKNYLNRINISLDSRQVDTKITSSTMAHYNKSIHVVGFKFPKNFNLQRKLEEHRVEQQQLEQTNKKINSIRNNLDIAFRFRDGMAYCIISNGSAFEIEKVNVEISYVPQYENESVKKMLTFENVKASGGATLEAPFLINSRQIEYNFRSIVPRE